MKRIFRNKLLFLNRYSIAGKTTVSKQLAFNKISWLYNFTYLRKNFMVSMRVRVINMYWSYFQKCVKLFNGILIELFDGYI